MLGVAGGVFADGDAVPDGDLLGADEHVFDEESQDVLPLGNLGVGVRALVQRCVRVDLQRCSGVFAWGLCR